MIKCFVKLELRNYNIAKGASRYKDAEVGSAFLI